MSSRLQALLEKIDAGWRAPPLDPIEDLRRRKLVIETLIGKILDTAPEHEAVIVARMAVCDSVDELRPYIARVCDSAEYEWPGICATVERLIQEYAEKAKRVPGADAEGGVS